MEEIPTLLEYDCRRAKIRCSLQWVVVHAYTDVDGLEELVLSDIENPFESDGGLKKNITTLLCSGDAYCRIILNIYNPDQPIHTLEEVIHMLCRHGMYILSEKDSVISALDLQKKPLDLNSHLLLIDMLMSAFVHEKCASIESVVNTIRKFSSFSASKDLPENMEEAFVLWLNKINLKVQAMKQEELESDKSFGQTREDGSELAVVENVSEDLCDGRSLAVLLHYYCPANISLSDICLRNPTSLADSWHNIQLCLNFCNKILLPALPANLQSTVSSSVLRPEDFLYSGTVLNANMISFLGNLYYYLETEGLQDVVRPLGHTVTCRRQKRIITADFPSMVGSRTQGSVPVVRKHPPTTMSEATAQILPEFQPLISSATKRSFIKTNGLDMNGMPVNVRDENLNSPIPFSSKPLLVRRNKETASASKAQAYQRSNTDYMHNKAVYEEDNMHMQPYIGAMDSMRKSNSYQGLDQRSTYSSQLNQEIDPVANRWHTRSPVQKEEIRFMPPHNGAHSSQFPSPHTGRKNAPSSHVHPQAAPSSARSSSLLSNVVMDFDDSNKKYLYGSVANNPTSVNLPWNGFQHVAQSENVSPQSFTANDLRLETARTTDDQTLVSSDPVDSTIECSSQFYDTGYSVTDAASNLSSVSSRTSRNGQSVFSSNGTMTMPESQDHTSKPKYPNPMFHGIPDIVSDRYSPGKPNSTTDSRYSENSCQHGISDTNSEASTILHPSSQQSYTIQNGTFNTVDSARAAGYPVIVNTDNTYILPTQSSTNPVQNHATDARTRRKSRMSSFAYPNGSVLSETPTVNGSGCDMMVGDSVVKLRNPRHSKSARSAKTTSWMEIAKQQNTEHSETNQRRHSNVMGSEKLAQLRHQLEERRKVIEKEKRMKEREWAKELLKIRKEMYAFAVQSQELKANLRGTKPYHRDETTHLQHVPGSVTSLKNEETSSDYSSQSPSPSSISASDRICNEHDAIRDFNQQTAHQLDQYTNFFASPLSSTTYLVHDKSVQGPSYIAKNSPQQAGNHFIATDEQEQSNQNTNNSTYIESTGETTPAQHLGRVSVEQKSRRSRESFEKTLTHQHPASRHEHQQDPPTTTTFTYHGITREHVKEGILTTESISAPTPTVHIQEASLSVDTCTRRSLFPGGDCRDELDVADQENIDPNNLTIATDQPSLGTYDSFCKLPAGSNHSTPAKLSPCQEGDQTTVTMKPGENQRLDAGDAMSTVIIQAGDSEKKKKGEGFELLDDTTPNRALAQKKEQFLLKQLKKEEELKRKKADRENLTEKRRQEERQRQEEAAAKKEEERSKRQQRLEDYKKRKMMDEVAQHMQEVGVIHGGKIKKHLSSSRTDLTQVHRTVRSRDPSPAKSSSPSTKKVSVVDSPRRGSDALADRADALHVGLSRMQKLTSYTHKNWETDSASASSAVSSDYTGPKLYKQPSVKSNRNLIYNAICHCCLPAKVNEASRNKTIEALETSDARHLMILFRDLKCQYRALYMYDPDAERLHKLTGNGPTTITPNMIEKLFKYNSGRKAFLTLPSKTLSVSIDAITVKNSVWFSSKKVAHHNAPSKK